jgi:hypothetical protein
MSLPIVLAYGLAPKQPAMAFAAALAAGVGFAGLLRMRAWSVLALGAAGATMVALGSTDLIASDPDALEPLLGGGLLVMAAVPFAMPLLRKLRRV